MKKITKQQEARLQPFREEWLRWGTCTDRANRPKAETAILAMRHRLGCRNKPIFLWVASPLAGSLVVQFMQSDEFRSWATDANSSLRASLKVSLGDSFRPSLEAGPCASLRASLRNSLRDNLDASLWVGLRDNLGESLRDSLWGSLWAGLWENLWESIESDLEAHFRNSLWESLGNSLWESLKDSLGANLLDSTHTRLGDNLQSSLQTRLRDSIRISLRTNLQDSLHDNLWDSLWASLWMNLGESLRTSLWTSLRESLPDSPKDDLPNNFIKQAMWGQHESYWIAFYLFCRDVVGVKYKEEDSTQLDLCRDIAQSCCWWASYENYVIVCERPTVCSLDVREVIHNQNGPAVAFSDGWAIYAWHGTKIPGEWIEQRDKLTAELALSQRNIELRRAACEILGWDNILLALKAKTVDKDADPEIGELLEVELPDAGRERFLRVLCGTGRTFAIPVPPTVQTALEANAWTWELNPEEYHPEVRT